MGPLEEVRLGGGERPALRAGHPSRSKANRWAELRETPAQGSLLLPPPPPPPLVLGPHLSQAPAGTGQAGTELCSSCSPSQALKEHVLCTALGLKGLRCCTRRDSDCCATFSKTKRQSRWLSIWRGTGTTESRAILANQGPRGACALTSGWARSPPEQDGLKGRDSGFLFCTQDASQVLLGTKHPLKGPNGMTM